MLILGPFLSFPKVALFFEQEGFSTISFGPDGKTRGSLFSVYDACVKKKLTNCVPLSAIIIGFIYRG